MKLLKDKKAVSHLIGYMLTLLLTAVVVSATLVATNNIIDNKASTAAELFAENLASRISDAIVNVCIMKDQNPDLDYSTTVDLPYKLVNRYNYYIELTNTDVYVKSTDGRINVHSTTYNTPNNVKMDISGRYYGSQQKLTISCEKTNYIYRFDFGTESSSVLPGYTKITQNCVYVSGDWPSDIDGAGDGSNWKYRSAIEISNPLDDPITDYEILIQLNDTNFCHSNSSPDGSDIRFFSGDGSQLNYWIERWYYPGETHTSRVWVKLTDLPAAGTTIYMYYGNPAVDLEATAFYGGDKTFMFFDDFEDGLDNWDQFKADTDDEIYVEDGILYLKNSAAVTANSFSEDPAGPYIIDVKAKAGGTGDSREASMFARFTSGGGAPYKDAYVFSSNNFEAETYPTLSGHSSDLIYWDWDVDDWISSGIDSSGNKEVNDKWNRLRFIINETDSVTARYYYDSFSVNGYASESDSSSSGHESFGLCTLAPDSGTIAQYDWVFVHKFKSLTSGASERDEAEPVAYVRDTYSQNFEWENGAVGVGTDGLGKDFVYSDSDGTYILLIKNLPATTEDLKYSVTFTLGNGNGATDPLKLVEGMRITLDGGGGYKKTIEGIDCDPYAQRWESEIGVVAAGELTITFDDVDDDYYWAVDEMTLELSDRIIKIEGG